MYIQELEQWVENHERKCVDNREKRFFQNAPSVVGDNDVTTFTVGEKFRGSVNLLSVRSVVGVKDLSLDHLVSPSKKRENFPSPFDWM